MTNKNTEEELEGGSLRVQRLVKESSKNIEKKQAEPLPPLYTRFDKQLSGLKEYWRTPVNVKEVAEQANIVATKVLNGEIDMDKARAYSAIVRVISQAMTLEMNRSRLLKQAADLNFDEE